MEHTVFSNLLAFTPQQGIMILIGLTLIYLAVRRWSRHCCCLWALGLFW